MGNRRPLKLLWRRLEDAKQELDLAHQRVTEIKVEKTSGAVPLANGSYAHIQALRAHDLAVSDYLKALGDIKAALLLDQTEPTKPISSGLDGITTREKEVLILIASGKRSKEIAAELGMAFRTAVCHRYRLYQKLQVHTSVELTRAALRMGLVKL